MKARHRILLGAAVVAMASCTSPTPYYYDGYYAYYPYVYDDAYYDAAVVSGFYYYPGYYYYDYRTESAAVSDVPTAVRLLLGRFDVLVDPSCLTSTKTADVDKDGIDANATITFACTSKPDGGTSDVTGSVTVKDLDDTEPNAGYSLTFNGLSLRHVTAAGVLTERVFNGTAAIAKAGADLHLTRDLVVDQTDTFPDGVSRHTSGELQAEGTLTPEVTPGSTLVTKGTLTLTGQGRFTGPDGATFTITRSTDQSLHWNGDCAPQTGTQGFDAGAIVYRSSQGRETRIAHDSCTHETVTNTAPR